LIVFQSHLLGDEYSTAVAPAT